MAARPQPDRQMPPVVQRIRLQYAKRGRLRFSSHRDFQRAFERAIRRAEVPIAFSSGFNPHPKVSYANAAPTGTASEAEYIEIGITEKRDAQDIARALDDALPPGLDIVSAVEAVTPDLVARLEASVWRIELPGVSDTDAQRAVDALLSAPEVSVQRLTKDGVRTFDARIAVVSARVATEDSTTGCAILQVVIRHVAPAVRPDDVLTALRLVADLVPPVPPMVTRLAQGPLDASGVGVGDPFTPDRAATSLAH